MSRNGAISLFLVILVFFAGACSPSNRHRVLSFFFDGVPDRESDSSMTSLPESQITEAHDTLIIKSEALFASIHYPYQDRQCDACHTPEDVGSLTMEEPDLCYLCHVDFNEEFPALHGPVDAGFCSACHLPHESRNEKLLVASGNELCFPCHVAEEVSQPKEHTDIGTQLCINCHDPHGIKEFPKRPKPIPVER